MTKTTHIRKYAYWRLLLWTCMAFATCHLSMHASESNSILLQTYRESVLPKLESIKESFGTSTNQPAEQPAAN